MDRPTVEGQRGPRRSTITLDLPPGQVVTTPRSDVMFVVTEWGIARLHNRPIEDRVRAMIAIAHPDYRDDLRAQAAGATTSSQPDFSVRNAAIISSPG